jgi:hypothetical protein
MRRVNCTLHLVDARNTEVFAIAQIDWLRRLRAEIVRDQYAFAVDHRELQRLLARRIFLIDQCGPIGFRTAALVASAHVFERLIDLANRANDILLKDTGKVSCVLFNVFAAGFPLGLNLQCCRNSNDRHKVETENGNGLLQDPQPLVPKTGMHTQHPSPSPIDKIDTNNFNVACLEAYGRSAANPRYTGGMEKSD